MTTETKIDLSFLPDGTDQEDALIARMEMWDMVAGFPVPKIDHFCGCGASNIRMTSYNFFISDRKESTDYIWRCCINARCFECGHLHDYRVVLTEDEFKYRQRGEAPATTYLWREVKRLMATEGE